MVALLTFSLLTRKVSLTKHFYSSDDEYTTTTYHQEYDHYHPSYWDGYFDDGKEGYFDDYHMAIRHHQYMMRELEEYLYDTWGPYEGMPLSYCFFSSSGCECKHFISMVDFFWHYYYFT